MAQKEKAGKGLSMGILSAAIVILTFLIVLCVWLFCNLAVFRQNGTAVTANGYPLTAADYNFFYYRSYYEYMNTAGGDAGTYGLGAKPDESLPLSEQVMYSDDGREVTWQSYFTARAEQLLRRTFLYYELAQEAGYELSEEQLGDVDYDFDEKIWFEADTAFQTNEEYLEEHYGKGMTEEIYRKNLKILFTANEYADELENSVEISDEELDATYQEGSDEYDIVFYRLFYLSGKAEDEAEQAEKMEQARVRAESLAKEAKTEEEFIALAEEYTQYNDAQSYWVGADDLRREQIRYAMSYYREWLAAPERQAGDTMTAAGENGYYIAMFLSRDDNDYDTVNLKYFTVSGEDTEKKLADFYEEFGESEGDAQAFFETAADYRDIDYSVSNRSIEVLSYDRQNRASVPEVMLDWCFAEERQAGDVETIEDKENEIIYVVYFDGYDMNCARSIVYKDLSGQRFREWEQEALAGVTVKQNFFFRLTDAA